MIRVDDRPPGDGSVSTLTLRIDEDDGRPNHPIVSILIDDQDRLGTLQGGFIGFDAEEILDSGALVPRDPPRRVAVYRCGGCGQPGCACVALVIERRGNRVVWSDFRGFTGVFERPLVDAEPTGGTSFGSWSITFDADQYSRELDRASSDRSWESPARRTARLLRDHLDRADDQLTGLGYWRGWVAPSWHVDGAFDVDFVGPEGQLVVTLHPTSSDPSAAAREMAQAILGARPGDWNVTIRNAWPPEDVRTAIEHRAARRRRPAADPANERAGS
ncbi:MAG TPA: hypothetical protein VFM27_11855 [Acidimicrobiales bacterium]|nr:hypothetical protein [Acidimicrobiales bacterium]